MLSKLMYLVSVRSAVAMLVTAAAGAWSGHSTALARGGVMRHAAVLILAGIVAASAVFITSVQAHSAITPVSNTGLSFGSTTWLVGTVGGSKFTHTQTFTTGKYTDGYTLSSVELDIVGSTYNNTTDTARVSIYTADSDGKPDALKYTLTNPSAVSDGLNTFTAPTGSTLEKETEYVVVVEDAGTGRFNVRILPDNGESSDDTGAGWAIRDYRWGRSSDAGAWSSSAEKLRISVNGVAEAPSILVSNSERADSRSRLATNYPYAQPFDTGSAPNGYTLDGIALDFKSAPTGSGQVRANVRADSSGDPGDVLHTLTNPASFDAGRNVFTAPADAELSPSTRYWVFLKYSTSDGGPRWWRTLLTNGIDGGSAAGWAIDEPAKRKVSGDWNVPGSNQAMQMQVLGSAKPTPDLEVSPTSLTIDEAGSGSFTVKLTTQPRANVTVAVSSDDAGAGAVSPASQTFTTSDWNTAQTVTVSGVNDSDTSNETLTVSLSASGGGYGSKTGSVSVNVTDDDTANDAPVFADGSRSTRDFAETEGSGTEATARDIGNAISTTDADNDTLTYSLAGADVANFGIVSSSGQLRTIAGQSYDHEAKASYSVTVSVTDGTATATIPVTIDVSDEDEPPQAPGAPTVTAPTGSATRLNVSWPAPDNAGRPDITGYNLRYREGMSGSWTDGPQDVTSRNAEITNLSQDTDHEVQVRARNAEGNGPWSDRSTGRTRQGGNLPPVRNFRTYNPDDPDGTGVEGRKVYFDWDKPDLLGQQANDYTLVGYKLEKKGGVHNNWFVMYHHENSLTSQFVDVYADPNTQYTYRIQARVLGGSRPNQSHRR